VYAEPTIQDFLELIDWHIREALDRATQSVNQVRGKASGHGRLNSGTTVILSVEAVRKEFDSGVEAVLGELKRVARKTKLDREDLRQNAFGRLENFITAAKAVAQTPEASSFSKETKLDERLAAFDQHLQFAKRQFDVGLLESAEPEAPPVTNAINIGSMTNSAIQQGSPGAKQTVGFTLNIASASTALTSFESAIGSVDLPPKTVDEVKADVETIRAQLAKTSPSRLIIQEAGKSLRNIVEGIAGGMLTPTVTAAAMALWSALGIG
jgi:hypothetical protein